jgi:hypothetical protein
MSIGTLVYSMLADDPGIAAIVGTRIYPTILPQNTPYEAITYQRISNTGTNGSTALRGTRYQINCWAETYAEAQALAAAVKARGEEFTDTSETPGIKMALVVNELDDYDDDEKVHRVIVDLILTTTGD